jgi:hypothetical protein
VYRLHSRQLRGSQYRIVCWVSRPTICLATITTVFIEKRLLQ